VTTRIIISLLLINFKSPTLKPHFNQQKFQSINMNRFTNIALLSILASSQAFAPAGTTSTRPPTNLAALNDNDDNAMVDRRTFGGIFSSAAAVVAGSAILPEISNAAITSQPTGRPRKVLNKKGARTYFKGKITVKDAAVPSEILESTNTALILTARPKNPAKIPPEVLASTRGSIPSVFTAIIPKPTLDGKQTFTLTANDITPEGDFGLSGDPYWWADEPEWEISARVDTDGALNTLDPSDLVGRTITSQIGEDKADEAVVCVDLTKRGFLGSRDQRRETV
jgi:hypothetical protein